MSNSEKLMEEKCQELQEKQTKNVIQNIGLIILIVILLALFKYYHGEFNNFGEHTLSGSEGVISWTNIFDQIIHEPQIILIITCLILYYFLKKYNSKWEIENVNLYNNDDDEKIEDNEKFDERRSIDLTKLQKFADAHVRNNNINEENEDKHNLKKNN
jgi:hypothetical protein